MPAAACLWAHSRTQSRRPTRANTWGGEAIAAAPSAGPKRSAPRAHVPRRGGNAPTPCLLCQRPDRK
eukprot:11183177-Lingulodinium_polyedra.AAC.1